MNHLVRAGGLLIAVLLFLFVGLRIIPVPEALADFGFHRKDAGANQELWASLPVQFASSAVCVDCHPDKYSLWQKGNHRSVSCESCHGPAGEHIAKGTLPIIPQSTRELCSLCHAQLISRPGNFPQVNMEEMGKVIFPPGSEEEKIGILEECVTCHDAHEPRAGMPPQVPHTLQDRSTCVSCHGEHEPWVEPPPTLPHTLEGRTDCLSCHGPQEMRGATLPHIPGGMESSTNCLYCHSEAGIKPIPADHAGRTSSTCKNCHQSE